MKTNSPIFSHATASSGTGTELMNDTKHGRIIPSANVESIVNSVKEIIEKDNFNKIGEEGKKHVEQHFTVHQMVDNLEKYLISELDKKQVRFK